jgi:cytochrome c
MMVMFTTTLTMIPPNMLTQVQTLAQTMAGNMTLGADGQSPQMDLGALAEGVAGMLQPQQRPKSTKKKRGSRSKQEEMRNKLV